MMRWSARRSERDGDVENETAEAGDERLGDVERYEVDAVGRGTDGPPLASA